MKSRLSQLQKGTIEFKVPELKFSPERLSGTLLPNKKLTMEISVASLNGVPMSLFFFSRDVRLRVSQPLSFGRGGKFPVEITTMGLTPGDRIFGEIEIVFNGGEVKIPYDFVIGMVRQDHTEYSFLTLGEFAEFAKRDYREAASLFSWKEFRSFPFMQDLKLRGLYFSANRGIAWDGALQEFLGAAGYPVERPDRKSFFDESRRARTEQRRGSEESLKLRRLLRLESFFLSYERYLFHERTGADRDYRTAIENLMAAYSQDQLTRLLCAYYYICEDDLSSAKDVLLSIQDRIQKEKLERKDFYCLFIWLASRAQKDPERLELSKKLVHKYYLEGNYTPLMTFLEYRLNPEYQEDDRIAGSFLKQCVDRELSGCALWQEMCFLWNRTGSRPKILGEPELRAIVFGLKHGLVSERLLFELFAGELKNPKLLNLFLLCLMSGYQNYKNVEFLQAVCTVNLQKNCTGPAYFFWYEEAVSRGLRLKGLYEGCLASVPENFAGPLFREMVLYFGYGKESASLSKEILYRNVLTFYRDDPEIFGLYRERIENLALRKVRDEVYSVKEVPAFALVLSEEKLNAITAPGMLTLFYLRKLRTNLTGMQKVFVHYPQLDREAGYPVEGQEALVPVYSEAAVISFEDAKGHRHFDPALRFETVFENEDLRKQCALYVSDSLPLKLSQADEVLRKDCADEQDLFLLIGLIQEKKIDDFFRARLYETLIDLSLNPSMRHVDCCEFLLEADYESFTPEYRHKFISSLVERRYYAKALERIENFGFEGVSDEVLQDLFENLPDAGGKEGDPMLLSLCWQLFADDRASVACLTYLAKFFSGASANMVALSRALRRKKIPMTEVLERTFITCIYSGNDRDLDQLFDWYLKEPKQDRVICDAYLTLRAHQYFTGKRRLTETAAAELKREVFGLSRVALLALLTFYAEKQTLTPEEKEFTETLLDRAAADGIVLGCFAKLQNRVEMPVEIEGRIFVEYRSADARDVTVIGQVMPDRRPFHRALLKIYPGVFARSFVLYKREWIDYSVQIRKADGTLLRCEGGILAQEANAGPRGSRYADISRLEQMIQKGDLKDTSELMRSLALKNAMIEDIFKDNE